MSAKDSQIVLTKRISACKISILNFNKALFNDVVSFEQPAPVFALISNETGILL